MGREWRCAVVGTGTVGSWHTATIPKVPGCKLVAICDIRQERATKALNYASLTDIPIYTDAAEMYRNEQIDAVHVCTPSGDHMDPAIAAMKAGKNVVVEKPMEIHADRIDKMIETSKQCGVRLAGIFQNRWNESNAAIKKAVDGGRFGRVAWAAAVTPWYRTNEYYKEVDWRGTWNLDGGGAVMNQGVHQVDLMQWVMGPVKTLSAYGSSRIHASIETEDTLTCALQFQSGAYGTFVSTTAMWPGGSTRLEVGGEFGTAVSDDCLRRFEFQQKQQSDQELIDRLGPNRPKNVGGGSSNIIALDLHGQNIKHIYDAWAEGRDADTAGPEARKAVVIIEAMYASMRKNGSPVEVK
jgi:UDP-N-acetyl-2-amino-2-deoxyglucuronate dehydrogenase